MLEKVVLELEWEPAAAKTEELEEGLALYQVKLERGIPEGTVTGNGIVYITDRPDAVRERAGKDACILLFLTEGNRSGDWKDIPYAVESLEGLDGDFLEKVYQRHIGEPWDILETERLLVREMVEADLEALYRIYDQADAGDFLDGLSADREEERAYIKSYIEKVYPFFGFGIWMLVEKEYGRCVGRAGFHRREGFAYPELGFIVEKKEQRKGYCLEACNALLEYGFRELEFEGIQALVVEGNRASEEICRKLGGHLAENVCWKGKKCLRFVWEAGQPLSSVDVMGGRKL